METELFATVYRSLIVIGFGTAFIAWLGYSILAPWSKYVVGRIVWALLLAITLVLTVSVGFVFFGDYPYRRVFALGTFAVFDVILFIIAYSIYTKQIRGYLKKKATLKRLKAQFKRDKEGKSVG